MHNYRAEDVKFLREGTELIIYARGILKWTYPHAFYMEIESDRKLFEFLQFDVERLTENLHELCEKPMEEVRSELGQGRRGCTRSHTKSLCPTSTWMLAPRRRSRS